MLKRRTGILFAVLGAVLLAAALLLFLHNRQEDENAGEAADAALTAVQEAIRESTQPQPELTPQPTEEATAPAAVLPVVNIDGNDYIGYLSIQAFDLELPIMADWSMEKLKLSPCLQYGSPLTDDAVIAGHNYQKHFRALHNIEVGENVTFTGMDGTTIAYTVSEVQTIDPRSVYDVINSPYDLVLYTCTIGGKSRVIVCCTRCPDEKL